MGEKSGSVVSHSLIFDSQVAVESGGLGVGELGERRCVVFFCECGEVRRRLLAKQKKKVQISNPWSILHFFLWWGEVGLEQKSRAFFLRDVLDKSLLLLESFQGELRVNNCRL